MMMKKLFFPCLLALSTLGLTSCDLLDGGNGGREVYYPTVDEMNRIDRENGLDTKSRGTPRNQTYDVDAGGAMTSNPRVQAAPQQPVVQPQQPAAAAPPPQIPELPPQSTIQKLRNS